MAETSKKRSVRIPLDYYKCPDRLTRWKGSLSMVAGLVALAWALGLGWDFWSGPRREARSRSLASHGPLVRAHATWDSQCEACHAPFRPIGRETWAAPVLGDSSRSDALCQRCHTTPNHHTSQSPQNLACASCHQDHRGREASLVRIADRHCTQCHSDLSGHLNVDREPFYADSVDRFDANPDHHPEFRATRADDPGRLEFDHARHLTMGIAAEGGGPVQTLRMLRESDRPRYREYAKGPKGIIELDCKACHQLGNENTQVASPSGKIPAVGAYMLPIRFENQCRACHPLNYDPAAPSREMAHSLQPAAVHASLADAYAADFVARNPSLLDQRIGPIALPGKAEPADTVEARQAIGRKVSNAEKILFSAKKCAECHSYETPGHDPVAALDHWDPEKDVRTAPTNVPSIWFRGAAFDHSAHRAIDCRGCHPRAYPDDPRASHRSKDVLIPGINKCLECHSPRRQGADSARMTGGAGSDCTECHRYHNRDAALTGIAAAPDNVEARSTIREFLLGTPATGRP
jgi:hypothetical protein